MSRQELLITLLKNAVDKCYENDKTLIDRSMEQASVARIFYYMQRTIDTDDRFEQFREYNLDCEYNKNMYNPKRLHPDEWGKRPDIILHKRLENTKNILILEFKNGSDTNQQNHNIEADYEKLKEFTHQQGVYKYSLGVSIKLSHRIPLYKYFKNGIEITERELHNE